MAMFYKKSAQHLNYQQILLGLNQTFIDLVLYGVVCVFHGRGINYMI